MFLMVGISTIASLVLTCMATATGQTMTRLFAREIIRQRRQLGEDACEMADQIRQLMRSYDMDGIQRLVLQTAVPPSSAGDEPMQPGAMNHGSRDT